MQPIINYLSRSCQNVLLLFSGRLLLLQRSLDEDENVEAEDEDLDLAHADEEYRQMRFTSPVVLASCVENIWTTAHKNRYAVILLHLSIDISFAAYNSANSCVVLSRRCGRKVQF